MADNLKTMTLNERMATLEEKVKQIMENHLPHLSLSIEKVDGKVDRVFWLMLTTLGAIIATFIRSFVK